jgi:hypothetical protein
MFCNRQLERPLLRELDVGLTTHTGEVEYIGAERRAVCGMREVALITWLRLDTRCNISILGSGGLCDTCISLHNVALSVSANI